MIRRHLALSITLACAPLTAWSQQTFSIEGSIFEQVADQHQMDPLLLYAISITESAAGIGKGYIQPQPYVFRNDRGPQFFNSRSKAEAALREALKISTNVDVGLMQINLHHHPQPDPLRLLDPIHNLDVAARYLKKTMSSTSDPVIGVGRYHSWRNEYASWYGQRVWKTYENLQRISAF